MGCSTSRLDDEEAVQLLKDRKMFIKQAMEYRSAFALGHLAYIQSLKQVSAALRNYVEGGGGDDGHDFVLDFHKTPISTPTKKKSPEIVAIPIKSFSPSPLQSQTKTRRVVNYLRSGGTPTISVEERPQSPDTVRVEAYSPLYQYEIDGFFAMDASHPTTSFHPSPYTSRPSFPPQSPQSSQWDFFWNPFSSLDFYGYQTRESFDHTTLDQDEMKGLRQVREEEGIPDLEDEDEEDEEEDRPGSSDEVTEIECESCSSTNGEDEATTSDTNNVHKAKGMDSQTAEHNIEVDATCNLEVTEESEKSMDAAVVEEEKPGFTVYFNKRPTSLSEVIKELENQFTEICNVANEVSSSLETGSSTPQSTSNELTVAAKLLNPLALFRSPSYRSTSSRLLTASSGSRDAGYESCSDLSEDSCVCFGSHQTTLDRLYAWEKKLYKEVKCGEKIRTAYEKKLKQLRNQDVKGEEAAAVDKTRAAIRDLHTQIKVSIHSVEAISKRIETLRDEELHPHLLQLVQRLARMWRTMAECYMYQKQAVDEAKLLLASTPTKTSTTPAARRPATQSAAALETELRNWRACFKSWITAQRSYVGALTGWALRCARSHNAEKLPFSPRRSGPAPPSFSLCVLWSRVLDRLGQDAVAEGFDFFAAGIGSIYGQMREEEVRVRRMSGGGGDAGEVLAVESAEKLKEEEKTAEVAVKVLFAGMSVAVGSLTEFAVRSADGYEEILKQWEKEPWGQ